MRIAIPVLAFAILASCEREHPAVAACEAYIQGSLGSPSTYRRISAVSYQTDLARSVSLSLFGEEDAERFLAGRSSVPGRHVAIEFDADNAFGTPLRATEHCYIPDSGIPSPDDARDRARLRSLDRIIELEEGREQARSSGLVDIRDKCCLIDPLDAEME